MRKILARAAVLALVATAPAHAVDLNVTHFGSGMYGVPHAIAKEKGYYKEIGLDVTGFLTSQGGGTTVRNVLASDLPYGEVALPAVVAAIQQGIELVIVHGGVISVSDQVWITRKNDERIKTLADLKGKKLGYSSPRSVTDMVTTMMLDANGLTGQVERRAVGGIGAGVAVLREGGVDITYLTEPVWSKEKGNFRAVFNSADWSPHVAQTVGVVSAELIKKNPALVRGLIEARRKGVEFLLKNPEESATIMAKEYKVDLVHARSAIANVLATKGGYWNHGEFDYEGMNVMLKGLVLVKAIEPGPFDWSKVVDESFLPAELRSTKPKS